MMKDQDLMKILVAVDGSDNALKTIHYLSKLSSFKKMELVLFTVYTRMPEYYWDMELQFDAEQRMLQEIKAFETKQKEMLNEFMEKARSVLMDGGFPERRLRIKMHERQIGIARDILKEAKRGYEAVVAGRKGMSKLEGLVLGSISTKLLEALDFVPLILVGENPHTDKVLLAFDGSQAARRAVDYVGSFLGGSGSEIALTHAIRSENEKYIEEDKKEMSAAFDKSKTQLIKEGFESSQLKTKMITGAMSRADALVQEANEEGYGTIVVGRRGLSRVQEFYMGRVSNKVIQLVRNQAVWVVN